MHKLSGKKNFVDTISKPMCLVNLQSKKIYSRKSEFLCYIQRSVGWYMTFNVEYTSKSIKQPYKKPSMKEV